MFALNHGTYKHSVPKMQKTFDKLGVYMAKMDTHKIKPSRKARYMILDAMKLGIHKMTAMLNQETRGDVDEEEENDAIEVNGEDGDLDV